MAWGAGNIQQWSHPKQLKISEYTMYLEERFHRGEGIKWSVLLRKSFWNWPTYPWLAVSVSRPESQKLRRQARLVFFQAQREWTYFNYSNISNVPGPHDLERIHWETTYSSKPWSHDHSTNAHSVQQWSNMLPVRLRLPVANLAAERLCEKKTEGSKQAGNLLRIGGWLCQM